MTMDRLVLAAMLDRIEQQRILQDHLEAAEGTLDVYRRAWARSLGGRLIPKTHEIDALVLTTEALVRERNALKDRVVVLEELLASVGASNEDGRGSGAA